MILQNPRGKPATSGGSLTIDELFRRAVSRTPDAGALVDPANRASFTDGAPRRLTFAQADRIVSAIAGRLRRLGLATDAIVALQTANTVDGVLALLAVLRAGMIAMPMPLLWRRAEAAAALGRVGAHALIVSGRVGEVDHFDLAMQIAADVFSVRQVCGFGANPPDGLITLDDLAIAETLDPLAAIGRERAHLPGAHVAVITWDVSAAGLVAVARSHAELIAGGLAVQLEGRLEQHSVIHSTLLLSSFAGLATALLPWLLVGGTLVLHHPFDPEAFAAQAAAMRCDTAVIPGPLVAQLAEAGQLSANDGLKRLLSVWHAPEQLARTLGWRDAAIALTDIQVFGEIGLIAATRTPDGRPAAICAGPIRAPRGGKNATVVGEVMATAAGSIALRGPMVPGCAFPPRAERSEVPHLKLAADGFVDTGYAGRIDRDAALVVTGPPPGLVGVGGYRFVMRDVFDLVSRIPGRASLTVLPDALAGQRLAGTTRDRSAVRQALAKLGANPLLVGAFRDARRSLTGR
jgi:acyl-CoA synthetase (AMP-forming)/AMP-acid ligase II